MSQPRASLNDLWIEHMSLPYPRGRTPEESGAVDPMDLVELDTFLAGYLSRLAKGSALDPDERTNLDRLRSELRIIVSQLSGATHRYFASLLAVAELAAVQAAH
jgi:hypothetical protein